MVLTAMLFPEAQRGGIDLAQTFASLDRHALRDRPTPDDIGDGIFLVR